VRASRLTSAAAAATAAVAVAFAAWPKFWAKGTGLLFGGLFWYAPTTPFGNGDNPRFAEYHWHGLQVWAGNLYVLIGSALLLVVLWRAARTLPQARAGSTVLVTGPSFAAKHES